ncbi:MAG: hypothetical protein IKB73_02690 [Ruminococcus sp.]|nr:hypothetical protein [Ruminococcus sp.]
MKKTRTILWGIVLMLAGLALAVNSLGFFEVNLFFDGWWTLFIIIPCFIGIFTDTDKIGNLVGLGIGVFLLFCCQNILSFDLLLKLIFPIIIITIGAKMIFGTMKSKKAQQIIENNVINGAQTRSATATFSGQDVIYSPGEVFSGIELNAIFGGVKCDLRNATIQNDCVIKISAVFGGIDIFLPQNVNVKVNSTAIFGGVSNKAHSNSSSNTVTVYIEGMCLFGGADIK